MIITNIGQYVLLLKQVFKRPEKTRIYTKAILEQMNSIGLGSLSLITIISSFIGAVMTLQIAFQLVSDFIPKTIIGSINRDSTILELSPTISAIVLAGKIGSAISSEIGTMRITEQIDALEIMGINAPGYLILPKVLAGVTMIPLLVILSMLMSISGGYVGGTLSGVITSTEYIQGITSNFNPHTVTVALTKSVIFGFIITSVPAYEGFYVKGGALEVAKASTRAVVICCITILLCDYLVTQMLL